MLKYREFWFCLVLLILVAFYLLVLQQIHVLGQYWVHIMHEYAQARGVSDKAVYRSQTHDLFVRFGFALAVALMALGAEALLLAYRKRNGGTLQAANWIFGLSWLPITVMAGRILLFLHQHGWSF